jgi:hypothetical protein
MAPTSLTFILLSAGTYLQNERFAHHTIANKKTAGRAIVCREEYLVRTKAIGIE